MFKDSSLKILSIGSDKKLFEKDSDVSNRIKEYATLVKEYHVVIFSLKSLGLKEMQIAPNVWIYPTNSRFKLSYPLDAVKIGKKIILEKKFIRGLSLITTQDPFECGWAGLKIKNKWRLPLEVQLHTDPFSQGFGGLLNFIRKRLAKTVLRRADSVRVVSEFLKNSVSAYTKAPIEVLPIFVNRSKIGGEVKFDVHARYPWHFILLMVCRLEDEKNIPLALETLALVRRWYTDTGLIIVGTGSKEVELKSLAEKMGLRGAVEFAGWQSELTSFYRTSNIFLQTSLYEGYGLALVEAGLNGLPVVTTPVGLAQELTHGQEAYIFPPSPEALASGIIDLIEHNHKRDNLRVNLKRKLDQVLLTKEEYLEKMGASWLETSRMIK